MVSMFQNGISQNTKCAIKDGFRTDSHICSCYLTSLCGLCRYLCWGANHVSNGAIQTGTTEQVPEVT